MRTFSFVFTCFSILFSVPTFAATPPGFDPASWNQLVTKVAANGSPLQAANAELHVFSHIAPADVSMPHHADYFSTLGEPDSTGAYLPSSVSIVSENWQKDPDGNWAIDQWIMDVALSGDLRRIYHGKLVETPSGSVLSDVSLPVGAPTGPESLAVLSEKLSQWLTWGL